MAFTNRSFPGKLSAVVKRGTGNFMVPGRIGNIIMSALKTANDEDREENPRQELHISDMGRCPRALWNRLNRPELAEAPDGASLVNFAVGRAFEERMSEAIASHPNVVGVRREVDMDIQHKGHKIHGHADLLVEWHDFKEVVEFKSTSSRSAAWTMQDGESKEEHKLQLGGYLYSAKQQGMDYERGSVVYGVKDAVKGEPVLFEESVRLTPTLEASIEKHLDDLVIIAETAAEPFIPSGFTQKRFPCGYCELSKHCWGS